MDRNTTNILRDRVAVDPVTLEVIRHGIISATDQIDANITRTAFSPYIYEYKDYAVGIAGPDGELIAQCTGGMPVFVADAVGQAVRDGLSIYGSENLHHGDVIVCNHAAVQGQHLNNTVMYTPIFAVARISGWMAHLFEQYANNRLMRPRLVYEGPRGRTFKAIDQR